MADGKPGGAGGPGGRCLKTATEALHALRLLGTAPEGLSPEELGIQLGKSKATARYLLNTLCQEGFAYKDGSTALYLLSSVPPWGYAWGRSGTAGSVELPDDLADAVSELYWRTRQRTYLAHLEDERSVVVDARGHQGLARIPGLQERISPGEAHALAVTKALVAASPELEETLRQEAGLTPFTGRTISEPDGLGLELAQVRQNGFALDREEFAEGFCCIAAPIFNPDGEVAASLGISTPPRRFATDYVGLVNEVVEVAATASEQWRRAATQPSPYETDRDRDATSTFAPVTAPATPHGTDTSTPVRGF